MEFHIENTYVDEKLIEKCIVASGNSYRTEIEHHEPTEKDLLRGNKLGSVAPGTGHDTLLNGMIVTMDVYAPLYWWKQAQRYHWFEFISSQSTMHCVTKFKIADRCTKNVDPQIVEVLQLYVNDYNELVADLKRMDITEDDKAAITKKKDQLWDTIIASLPCGFVLGATMTTNYRQLKTMFLQRKDHKLKEWHAFCDWCETLPKFSELTGLKNLDNKVE